MTFLNDTFTDTDGTLLTAHTPDSGGSWDFLTTYGFGGASSGVVITGNAVRSTNTAGAGGNAAFLYSGTPPSADYSLYATLRYNGANNRQTGILLRASTSANSGYLLFCDPTSAGFTLYRSASGSLTSLGSYAGATASGAAVDVAFGVSGTGATVSLTVSLNGVSRITANDTSGSRYTSAGNAVLILYGGTDFRVESITSTPPINFSGTITLDAFTMSGDLATGALSQLSSGFTLDAFALSGFLGLAPGRIDTSPFKNWTGTLLSGITIPRLTFLRLSDMSTVLQLTNQTTAGDGVLAVTNAAFTPGTTYLVVAASTDGASLGAEIYTAT